MDGNSIIISVQAPSIECYATFPKALIKAELKTGYSYPPPPICRDEPPLSHVNEYNRAFLVCLFFF